MTQNKRSGFGSSIPRWMIVVGIIAVLAVGYGLIRTTILNSKPDSEIEQLKKRFDEIDSN